MANSGRSSATDRGERQTPFSLLKELFIDAGIQSVQTQAISVAQDEGGGRIVSVPATCFRFDLQDGLQVAGWETLPVLGKTGYGPEAVVAVDEHVEDEQTGEKAVLGRIRIGHSKVDGWTVGLIISGGCSSRLIHLCDQLYLNRWRRFERFAISEDVALTAVSRLAALTAMTLESLLL